MMGASGKAMQKNEIKEENMKQKITIGTHMSIAQGLEKTAENVVKMEADTMQIFSRNPRGSNFRTPTEKETEGFQWLRPHSGPCALYHESGKRHGKGL